MTTPRLWDISGKSWIALPKSGVGSIRPCMRWSIWSRMEHRDASKRLKTIYIRSGHCRTLTTLRMGQIVGKVSGTEPEPYVSYWVTQRSCNKKENSLEKQERNSRVQGLLPPRILAALVAVVMLVVVLVQPLRSLVVESMVVLAAKTWNSLDITTQISLAQHMIPMLRRTSHPLLQPNPRQAQLKVQSTNLSQRKEETMRKRAHLMGHNQILRQMRIIRRKRRRKRQALEVD